jgi:hypothetical protein
MTTPRDKLAKTIAQTDFTVTYDVTSEVGVSATDHDLNAFMNEYPEAQDWSYETLCKSFLEWCIQEDGFEYHTRGEARASLIIENANF